MLKAADAHPDRIFAGIFQHRYNPIFQCLHELVAKGAFGKPISAAMQHRGLRTQTYYDSGDWRGTWDKEGGGVLINQAIHYLDLFQWVMGGVRDVEAFFTNATLRKCIETEDTIVGAVRFKNGALGTVEATNAAFVPWETTLEITGTDGAIEIRDGQIRKNTSATRPLPTNSSPRTRQPAARSPARSARATTATDTQSRLPTSSSPSAHASPPS